MITSIIAFVCVLIVRILFGYLATKFSVLETWVTVFTWLTIAVAAVAAVFIVLEIAMKIRNSKHKGGGGK